MKGKFIIIEGGEGVGKSVCLEYLRQQFSGRSDIIFTREPGGTEISEQIREVLMDKNHGKMTALTELFLFCASRAQHVEEKIKPALLTGKNIICDRFDPSTLAYQIYGRNRKDLEAAFLQLNNIAKDGVEPDAVIYLDVEPEVGLERKSKHRDGLCTRFDEEKLDFHKKVREGFLAQHESDKNGKWHLILTTKMSENEVKERVFKIVGQLVG